MSLFLVRRTVVLSVGHAVVVFGAWGAEYGNGVGLLTGGLEGMVTLVAGYMAVFVKY